MTALGWRLVRLVSLVAAVLAVVLSPAWGGEAGELPNNNPPYTPPAVAALLPDDEFVAAAFDRDVLLMLDSPPKDRLWTLDTSAAQDVRNALLDEAWQRRWHTFTPGEEVVVVAEVHRVGSTSPNMIRCEPQETFAAPGATAAGWIHRDASLAAACARIDRGRQHFSVETVALGEDGEARAASVVTAVVAHLDAQIEDRPDLEWQGAMPHTQNQMRRAEMISLLVLIGVLTIPGIVGDKQRWLRIARRPLTSTLNPEHEDIEGERRSLAVRNSALGAVRLAMLLWAVWPTLTVPAFSTVWGTVLTLVGTYLAGLLLQRRLTRDRAGRGRTRLLRGPGLVLAGVGAVGTVLMLAVAVGAWRIGNSLLGWGSGTGDFATWQVRGGATFMLVIAVLLLIWSPAPLALGRRLAMAVMRDRPRQPGAPTLLLRTFRDDRMRIRVQRRDRGGLLDSVVMKRRERYEEILTFTLAQYGPPIAVGQPGQRIPPGLGGQRITFSHETWKAGVGEFADEAALICLTLGKTEGLSWEMNHVASSGLLHKTIFVLPPGSRRDRQERLALFAESYGLDPGLFDTQSLTHTPVAICWPLGWTRPMIVSSGSIDDISYDLALARCAEALLHGAPVPPEQLILPPALPEYRDLGLAPSDPAPLAGWLQSSTKIWTVNIALSLVTPLFIPLLIGDPIGDEEPRTQILSIDAAYAVTTALGGTPEASYALVGDQTVIRGNFISHQIDVVGDLASRAAVAQVADGVLYYATAGVQEQPTILAALDLPSGDELWQADLDRAAQGITVTTDSVLIPDGDGRRVLVFDRSSGQAGAPIELPCRPWHLAAGPDGTVWTSCPAEAQLIEVEDGSVTAHPMPAGGTDVMLIGATPYVYVSRESVLRDPFDPDFALWTRQPQAKMAAAPGVMVVEGIDRVTLLSSDLTLERRNTWPSVTSLVVDETGLVQYTKDNSWILLLPAATS